MNDNTRSHGSFERRVKLTSCFVSWFWGCRGPLLWMLRSIWRHSFRRFLSVRLVFAKHPTSPWCLFCGLTGGFIGSVICGLLLTFPIRFACCLSVRKKECQQNMVPPAQAPQASSRYTFTFLFSLELCLRCAAGGPMGQASDDYLHKIMLNTVPTWNKCT